MEAKSVADLPQGGGWRYEPKWDGFRCLASRDGGQVRLVSKSGRPLERYFPDVASALEGLPAGNFMLDGELLIEADDGYSFSELQLRLHPAASRVRTLAAKHPARHMVFDLLAENGEMLLELPFETRRSRLEKFFGRHLRGHPAFLLSPQTESLAEALGWVEAMGGRIDGLIAKYAGDTYRPGERQMRKYKFLRTADCVVGGFRYGTNARLVGSLLLGLYDEAGLLHHVGFTSSIPAAEKKPLTARLEKLVAGPGFTGRAPGGPSRWSTGRSTQWQPLAPELVAEVRYDHVTEDRFRHGTAFLRWRPDKAPRQCTFEQLRQPPLLPLPGL